MNQCIAFLKKYAILIGLLILEIILLISAAKTYVKDENKFVLEIPYTEMNLAVPLVDYNGYYMDSNTVPGYSGLFVYTNPFSLPRGSYDVTVVYHVDSVNNKNTLTGEAETERYNAFRMDKIVLDYIADSINFDVVTRSDAENVVIKCNFGGEGSIIIRSLIFRQNNKYFRTTFASIFLLSVLVDLICLLAIKGVWKRLSKEVCYGILAVTAIGLLSSIPMMTTGLKVMDDMSYHLMRIQGVCDGLLDGQFPVRLNPNWAQGYGYSCSTIYNDCFLYVPGILRLIGYSLQTCWKVYIISLNLFTALIMYYCAKKMFGKTSVAVIGTVMYSFAPMRIMEIYPRGDIGEGTAMAFLPLMVFGLYKIYTDDVKDKSYRHNWFYLTLGFTGILSCHLEIPILASFFVLLNCVLLLRRTLRKETMLVLIKTVCYTSLLIMWFVLPCLYMSLQTSMTQATDYLQSGRIQRYGINVSQIFTLVYPAWGELLDAKSGAAGEDALSIGLPLVLGAVLFLAVCIYKREAIASEAKKKLTAGKYMLGFGTFILFMTTCYFPWDFISSRVAFLRGAISHIQMPWRCSVIAICIFVFIFMIACDDIISEKKNGVKTYAIGLIVLLGLIAGYFNMDTYLNELSTRSCYDDSRLARSDYFMGYNTFAGFSSDYLYRFAPRATEGVYPDEFVQSGTSVSIRVVNVSEAEGYVELPICYYAEYYAKCAESGEEITIVPGENMVLRLTIPQDFNGSIVVKYKEPFLWRIAEILSLITLGTLLCLDIYRRRKVLSKE